jgi:hypothetical protein
MQVGKETLIMLLEAAAAVPPGDGKPADWLRLLELMDLPRHSMFAFRRAVRAGEWRTKKDPIAYLKRPFVKRRPKGLRNALRASRALKADIEVMDLLPANELEALQVKSDTYDRHDRKEWQVTDELLERLPSNFHSEDQPFALDKLASVPGINEWDLKVIRCLFNPPTVGREAAMQKCKAEAERLALQAAWKRWDRGATVKLIQAAMRDQK